MRKLTEQMDRARHAVEYQKRKMKFSRRLAALTLGIARVAETKMSRVLFP
jgi:glutamate dehydrogenase (NAD(P)+)